MSDLTNPYGVGGASQGGYGQQNAYGAQSAYGSQASYGGRPRTARGSLRTVEGRACRATGSRRGKGSPRMGASGTP